MSAGTLIKPTRRHNPGILIRKVTLLRSRNCCLIPGMSLVDDIAKWVMTNELVSGFPVIVKRAPQEYPDAKVDIDQVVRDKFAIYNYARRDIHLTTPLIHRFVTIV